MFIRTKSHSGGTIHLGATSASFLSITQKPILADSSTESEFISTHTIANNIIWLRGLLMELGFPQPEPTLLMQDNLLANANFHFAQEATLNNILEFSLSETYAPKQIRDEFPTVRTLCVGGRVKR